MAWRDRTNLYICPKLSISRAPTDKLWTGTFPTVNPIHITQQRNLAMAPRQEMATPTPLAVASTEGRRVEVSCLPELSKMMVTW